MIYYTKITNIQYNIPIYHTNTSIAEYVDQCKGDEFPSQQVHVPSIGRDHLKARSHSVTGPINKITPIPNQEKFNKVVTLDLNSSKEKGFTVVSKKKS